MKKQIAYKTVKRKLIFTLVSLFIFFLGFICPVSAQWNFIPQITISGPCSSATSQAEIAALNAQISSIFTGFGLPTQSLCESIRQQVLAIRASIPEYDSKGNYIGDCSVFYTCTACMGSDIVFGQGSTSGQVNPGDVSINGILEGKAIFTSHQSSAFEDWAQEYKQLLSTYGINSILGANFKFPRTPLTDDKAFNILYITLSGNFRPMIKPVLTPSIAPAPTPKIAPAPAPKTEPDATPKTELSGIPIPVMGGSPLTQSERERQNLPNKNGQYIDLMTYIRPESGIEESTPATADLSESKEYKMVQAVFDKIGEYKIGELPAFTGGLLLSTVNETDKLIRDITINGKYSAEELAAMNPVKVIVNNVITEQVTSQVKQKIDDMKESLGLEFLGNKYGEATKKGAELGLKLMNETNKLQELWAAKWH